MRTFMHAAPALVLPAALFLAAPVASADEPAKHGEVSAGEHAGHGPGSTPPRSHSGHPGSHVPGPGSGAGSQSGASSESGASTSGRDHGNGAADHDANNGGAGHDGSAGHGSSHGSAGHDGSAAAARPRGLVLGGFGAANVAILGAAAVTRRRGRPAATKSAASKRGGSR